MRTIEEAVTRHPELALSKPVRISTLLTHFHPLPPNSLMALRRKMGPFKRADAYRFSNHFPITEENAKAIRSRYSAFSDFVIGVATRQFATALAGMSVQVPAAGSVGIPSPIADVVIGKVTDTLTFDIPGKLLDRIVAATPGDSWGRCGGMAFSGYDLYLAGWPVDQRLGTSPPTTGDLGDYIFQRLLDSLDANAGTFLTWLVNCYLLQAISKVATTALLAAAGSVGGPIGTAIGVLVGTQTDIFGLGGPQALLEPTKDEWTKIKARLDEQAAWPIGIIFGDTPVPVNQHQILATGYSDKGDGTATLDVWDNNDDWNTVGDEIPRTLTIDFRGSELQVANFHKDRPVKGIFLEEYSPNLPPGSLKFPPAPAPS